MVLGQNVIIINFLYFLLLNNNKFDNSALKAYTHFESYLERDHHSEIQLWKKIHKDI